jgi:hypothetical protein
MRKNGPLERTIVEAIVKKLKGVPNGIHVNYHGNPYTRKGTPDLFFTCPAVHGRAIWIEVKRPGEKSTLIQTVTQELLREAGAIAFEACSVADVVVTLTAHGVVFP